MPLILPGNVTTATAATAYSIANSCRFNEPDSPAMSRGSISATNRRTWTFSYWIKRVQTTARPSGAVGTMNHWNQGANDGSDDTVCLFWGAAEGDYLQTWESVSDSFTYKFNTKMAFRDLASWYHIVLACDTTQGTEANRFKIYINGTLLVAADFETANYPAENLETLVNSTNDMRIGKQYNNRYIDGYLAEFAFIDGTAYAASDFGEFDSDSPNMWKPKDLDGLTFGTNGFWLDFEDSSALGNDVSGNNNDFTPANLAAVDQATDTPTNNFATLNPLNNYWAAVSFTEANCVYTSNNTSDYLGFATSTLGVSKGRWYFEAKTSTASGTDIVGISSRNMTSRTTWLGSRTQEYGYYQDNGEIRSNSADTSYGQTYTVNDIIGIYLDLEDNKMYVTDNGSIMNSGTGHSITAAASTDSGFYHFAVGDNGDSTQVWQVNFGGCPAFAISSAVADDNGYGSFEYSPNITGDSSAKSFYALCTKNIAEFG